MERATQLLRYRFDTFGQLEQHLHVVDGAALIFLPDPKKGVPAVGRVLLDLAIAEPPQQAAVRGEVISPAEGGSWLQLADARLPRRLHQGGFEGRREPRLSADALLQLRDSTGSQLIAQLFDLGTGGMRVRGAGRLLEGETYSVRLLNEPPAASDLGIAQVVRIDGAEAGMRFVAPWSPQVPLYVASLLEAWMSAPEIEHAAGCCRGRGLLEPPLPPPRQTGAPAP
jgi:hypothetical protein